MSLVAVGASAMGFSVIFLSLIGAELLAVVGAADSVAVCAIALALSKQVSNSGVKNFMGFLLRK
jgi:hypothetical protein